MGDARTLFATLLQEKYTFFRISAFYPAYYFFRTELERSYKKRKGRGGRKRERELEQSKREGETGLETEQFLDYAVQATAKLKFVPFLTFFWMTLPGTRPCVKVLEILKMLKQIFKIYFALCLEPLWSSPFLLLFFTFATFNFTLNTTAAVWQE